MLLSPEIIDLIPALHRAKAEFAAVTKDAFNPHFRSKYADLGAVLDAVEPALQKHGLMIVQPTLVTEDGRHRVQTILFHVSGQWMASEWELHPVKADPQGEGSALTYGRRYGVMALLGLAPEDDDGNDASTRNSTQRTENERANEERREAMREASEKSVDWPAELAKATTSEQVITLGRRAAQVGEFEKHRAIFVSRKQELEKAEMEAAQKLAGEQLGAQAVSVSE